MCHVRTALAQWRVQQGGHEGGLKQMRWGGAVVGGRWSDVSKRRRIQDPKPINAMKHNEDGRLSLEGALDKT